MATQLTIGKFVHTLANIKMIGIDVDNDIDGIWLRRVGLVKPTYAADVAASISYGDRHRMSTLRESYGIEGDQINGLV